MSSLESWQELKTYSTKFVCALAISSLAEKLVKIRVTEVSR